jgi:ubiquinone/menaquinone biosynthesis C-methylase UbiE
VACGTGFLTRHLRGEVIAIDQSPSMAAIATARLSVTVARTRSCSSGAAGGF